jgi:predicted dehydrogenase
MIASGELGTLVGARALVGAYYTLMCATTDQYLEAPNALVLGYTHQIDYLRLFLGEVIRVSAEADTLGVLDMMPEPNVFSMLLRYRSGAIAAIHLDFVQHPQRHSLELYGDRKTAIVNTETWQLRIFDRDREGYQEIPVPVARDELYRTQIAAFLNSVRSDRIPICSVDDGVAAVAVAEAAVQSSREHCMVEL